MCYIDDTTNIISCNNIDDLQIYVQRYYYLLDHYYAANKLKLNEDKTQLLISCKNRYRQLTNNFHIMAGNYKITQKESVKILGYYLSLNLNHDIYINKVVSKINYRLHLQNKLYRYMDQKVRILVSNATIMSILYYIMPILINVSTKQLSIINTIINKVARNCIGYKSYKWSNAKVLNTCSWINGTHALYYNI